MDIRAWISMWISTLVWIIEDWHQKIMDIHVDIRGFLEIHVWICYGFSDQGWPRSDFLFSSVTKGRKGALLPMHQWHKRWRLLASTRVYCSVRQCELEHRSWHAVGANVTRKTQQFFARAQSKNQILNIQGSNLLEKSECQLSILKTHYLRPGGLRF